MPMERDCSLSGVYFSRRREDNRSYVLTKQKRRTVGKTAGVVDEGKPFKEVD
jgi:hypothetical protein